MTKQIYQAQVHLSTDFFKNEVDKLYGWNWPLSFVREFVQNSADAGATFIKFTQYPDDILEIEDDGCGMSLEVFQDVYLALGKTTKDGNSLGGFGRARILTSFAQKRYEVRSADFLAVGVGTEVSVQTGLPMVQGCTFRINTLKPTKDFKSHLRQLANLSILNMVISWDGEVFPQLDFSKSELIHEKDGMAAYKVDGLTCGPVVQVSGLFSFKSHGEHLSEVVVTATKEHVTQSRESFKDQYAGFISELNMREEAAVSRVLTYRTGNGVSTFSSRSAYSTVPAVKGTAEFNVLGDWLTAKLKINADIRAGAGAGATSVPADPVPVKRMISMIAEKGQTLPANKDEILAPTSPKMRILARWFVMLDRLIDITAASGTNSHLQWTVGWGFYNNSDASFSMDNGVAIFSLSFKFAEKGITTGELLGLAIHELTHLHSDYHGGEFASRITANTINALERYKELETLDKSVSKASFGAIQMVLGL